MLGLNRPTLEPRSTPCDPADRTASTLAAMFNIGGGEVLVIALIALIVLGPQRLPDAARQVGKAMGELIARAVRADDVGELHPMGP